MFGQTFSGEVARKLKRSGFLLRRGLPRNIQKHPETSRPFWTVLEASIPSEISAQDIFSLVQQLEEHWPEMVQ